MLVLRRRDGQWLDVVHRSGDVLRIRVYDVGAGRRTASTSRSMILPGISQSIGPSGRIELNRSIPPSSKKFSREGGDSTSTDPG